MNRPSLLSRHKMGSTFVGDSLAAPEVSLGIQRMSHMALNGSMLLDDRIEKSVSPARFSQVAPAHDLHPPDIKLDVS